MTNHLNYKIIKVRFKEHVIWRKRTKGLSDINLNAGIVIFGLISIYLLINIVIYFTTERTAFYEVISGSNAQEANVSYNGIAIRNEIVQSAQDSGYIDYYVREGSRVSLNTTLYSIDSTGELNKWGKQKES